MKLHDKRPGQSPCFRDALAGGVFRGEPRSTVDSLVLSSGDMVWKRTSPEDEVTVLHHRGTYGGRKVILRAEIGSLWVSLDIMGMVGCLSGGAVAGDDDDCAIQ